MTVLYGDSSALVKLVRHEAESDALRAYIDDVDLVSSELVLAEIPRAIHRAAAQDQSLSIDLMLERAGEVVDELALRPVDRGLLLWAGALAEPSLRTLDAIHVAAAIGLGSIEAFVTYDERQAAVARLAGLQTVGPGT